VTDVVETLLSKQTNSNTQNNQTKMDVKNIGIVFGPSVVRKEIEDNGFMELRSAGFQAEIVCLLINYIVDVFGDEVVDLIKEGLDDPEIQAHLAAQQQKAAAPQQPAVIPHTTLPSNAPQFPSYFLLPAPILCFSNISQQL